MITPKRAIIVISSIYLLMAASLIPTVFILRLGWKFFPYRNVTKIGLIFSSDQEHINRISSPVNNVLLQVGSFLAVIVFTVLLVKKLKDKAKWRHVSATKVETTSGRDKRVAAMVALISTTFIFSYSFVVVQYMWVIIDPEFHVGGRSNNIFLVTACTTNMIQTANSIINSYIYLKMSTKYRKRFLDFFTIKSSCRNYQ